MFLLFKVCIVLITPLGSALLLGLIALVLGALRRHRSAWVLGAAAFLWLTVWSLPVASDGLRGTLEGEYPPQSIAAVPTAAAIVVLGGGIEPEETVHSDPDLDLAADRIWYAARLYHAAKAPLMVLTGGGEGQRSGGSEAAAMARVLADFGVPREAMLLEEHSHTTGENAQNTAALLRERGIGRVLLVTSALHMHRALGLFERAGLRTYPAATDYEVRERLPVVRWLPSASALWGSGRAMKEWFGRFDPRA